VSSICFGLSGIVAEDPFTPEQRAERGSTVGYIVDALTIARYRDRLADAGFTDITNTVSHQVTDGMNAAIIHATQAQHHPPPSK
jgi:orotidine-5'-phosphate decarboxylase